VPRTFSTVDVWPPGLDDAVTFAVHWHGDQKRPAGEPYVEHLKEATAFLAYGAGVTDPALPPVPPNIKVWRVPHPAGH
jgi:hypothetical protein